MMRQQCGAALMLTLVLLTGLGALALAAAAAAMTALALAGHQHQIQNAFEAAEAGISQALRQAAEARSAGRIAETVHAADIVGSATYRAETTEATGPGTLPVGFSVGEYGGAFGARNFFIDSEGRAGRGARVRLEQGFYLVAPAS